MEVTNKKKDYHSNYYQMNKEKFTKLDHTCIYCNYTSTNSNMKKHIKTKKHEYNRFVILTQRPDNYDDAPQH